jgi:hypothetical protein
VLEDRVMEVFIDLADGFLGFVADLPSGLRDAVGFYGSLFVIVTIYTVSGFALFRSKVRARWTFLVVLCVFFVSLMEGMSTRSGI